MGFSLNYHVGPLNGPREPRYKVSQVLSNKQVPHAIWFEDALVYYGVPTAVFDLYILVEDIDLASNTLATAGWTFDMQGPHRIGNAEVDLEVFPQQRLISPDNQTRTVLLPAADWKFPLTLDTPLQHPTVKNDPSQRVPLPPLPGLLDALIECWLDCPSDDSMLLLGLACQIFYLYTYVPALKEKSFAEKMKYENRQFHLDVLMGMKAGTVRFRNHQRAIRDALRQGQYELQECSVSSDSEYFFSFPGGVNGQPI